MVMRRDARLPAGGIYRPRNPLRVRIPFSFRLLRDITLLHLKLALRLQIAQWHFRLNRLRVPIFSSASMPVNQIQIELPNNVLTIVITDKET